MSSFSEFGNRPIWRYHAEIVRQECILHRTRILNLLSRWKCKAREGLLPLPEEIGVFLELAKMHDESMEKLEFYTDEQLARWNRRSFEDVIEMTDALRDMHTALAAAERTYWQRIEGYEAAAVDAIRSVAFSETGTMQQICTAADFVCLAFWDRIFGRGVCNWKGIVTFGHYHEFRNWMSFIFAPDYVQLFNYRMWIYFAHEVVHSAIEALQKNTEFVAIYDDLVKIFAELMPQGMRRSSEEYLARETVSDIVATIVAGASYFETLCSLKYYPSITVFSKFKFLHRTNRYPMFLRSVISAWTLTICWGLEKNTPLFVGNLPGKSPSELVRDVQNEDMFENQRALFFLSNPQERDAMLAPYGLPRIEDIHERLIAVYNLEDPLKSSVIPSILNEIVRRNIIPRLKNFVKVDFFGIGADQCYYRYEDQSVRPDFQAVYLGPDSCKRSADAREIENMIAKKQIRDGMLLSDLLQGNLRTDADPVDIVACLNRMSTDKEGSTEPNAHAYEGAALMSICLQEFYRKRRFSTKSDQQILKKE